MSKPLALLSTIVAAGVLVVTAVLFCADPNRSALKAPHFGETRATSEIFLPVNPRHESRILRHLLPDGTAVDDVLMRDGTTKHIVYDRTMVLRQVFAYFKAPEGEQHGPLMYEKTHDAQGHLASERHLRLDGSLEMDGQFDGANNYVRHLYFPAAGQDPHALSVSAVQNFDRAWHPTIETDFRPDGTTSLVHTWSGADDLVKIMATDGKTIVSAEGKKNGDYYSVSYYPDGQSIKQDIQNGNEGTTIQWFRQDAAHSLALKVTFDNKNSDQIVIANSQGQPLLLQVWSPDADPSGQPASDDQPRLLDRVDHFRADGKVDVRYQFDRQSQSLTSVTYYQGDNPTEYGARVVYTVNEDGLATRVTTFDSRNSTDSGKALTEKDNKRFTLDPWLTTRPSYVVPALKEGLKLYGEPPSESYDFD